jgi:isopentenyl-diphosphate delta-isomerase
MGEPLDALVEARKGQHLELAATQDVEAAVGAGWSDVRLVHQSLPVADLEAIELGVPFLGHRLAMPLMIAGMTGGHARAAEVNACLARAAERYGIAMGVGSQRAAVRRPDLAYTFGTAREHAPTALVIGNIGAPQLVAQGSTAPLSVEEIRTLLGVIRADALAIHLNYLQELVQPEGDRRAAGVLEAIEQVVQQVAVPVIAKETGAGMSRRTSQLLAGAGAAALDVGGLGGTSFAAVEALRAKERGDVRGQVLGRTYRDWGIPTAVAVVEAVPAGIPVIATGGIRTGLDAAKALALGATLVGVARPLLSAALEGGDAAVDAWVTGFAEELRAAVFLTGCRAPHELRSCPRVILGETREWLNQLTPLTP